MRKNKLYIVISIFLLVAFSCASSQKSVAITERKASYKAMLELVESKRFEIENDWVIPMRIRQISLIGNSNYLRFVGDSVAIFLPYFGVRHSGGGYGSDGGIEFEGSPKNLKIEPDSLKHKINISFEGNHNNEQFDFQIQVFSNKKTSVYVNSSQRDAISYRGKIRPLSKEKQKKK